MISKEQIREEIAGCSESQALTAAQLIAGEIVLDASTGYLSDEHAARFPFTAQWVRNCYHPPDSAYLTMKALDEVLSGFGVEAIQVGGKVIAEYVNQGDSYAATIVRDHESGEYCLTSWADFYDVWETEKCEAEGLVRCGYCGHLTPKAEEWSNSVCEECGRNVQTGEVPVRVDSKVLKRIKRLHKLVERELFTTEAKLSFPLVLRALETLTGLVHEYPDDESDELWTIGECAHACLSDMIASAYWFCVEFHCGQDSQEYRLQCALSEVYTPGSCSKGPEPGSSERSVYLALVERWCSHNGEDLSEYVGDDE